MNYPNLLSCSVGVSAKFVNATEILLKFFGFVTKKMCPVSRATSRSTLALETGQAKISSLKPS